MRLTFIGLRRIFSLCSLIFDLRRITALVLAVCLLTQTATASCEFRAMSNGSKVCSGVLNRQFGTRHPALGTVFEDQALAGCMLNVRKVLLDGATVWSHLKERYPDLSNRPLVISTLSMVPLIIFAAYRRLTHPYFPFLIHGSLLWKIDPWWLNDFIATPAFMACMFPLTVWGILADHPGADKSRLPEYIRKKISSTLSASVLICWFVLCCSKLGCIGAPVSSPPQHGETWDPADLVAYTLSAIISWVLVYVLYPNSIKKLWKHITKRGSRSSLITVPPPEDAGQASPAAVPPGATRQPFGTSTGQPGHPGSALLLTTDTGADCRRGIDAQILEQAAVNILLGRIYLLSGWKEVSQLWDYIGERYPNIRRKVVGIIPELEAALPEKIAIPCPHLPDENNSHWLAGTPPGDLSQINFRPNNSEVQNIHFIIESRRFNLVPLIAEPARALAESLQRVLSTFITPDHLSGSMTIQVRKQHDRLAEHDPFFKGTYVLHAVLCDPRYALALRHILSHEFRHDRMPEASEADVERETLLDSLRTLGREHAVLAYEVIAAVYDELDQNEAADRHRTFARNLNQLIAGLIKEDPRLKDNHTALAQALETNLFASSNLQTLINDLVGKNVPREPVYLYHKNQLDKSPRQAFAVQPRKTDMATLRLNPTEDMLVDLETLYHLRTIERELETLPNIVSAYEQSEERRLADETRESLQRTTKRLDKIVQGWPEHGGNAEIRNEALVQLQVAVQFHRQGNWPYAANAVRAAIRYIENDLLALERAQRRDAHSMAAKPAAGLDHNGNQIEALSMSAQGVLDRKGRLYVPTGYFFRTHDAFVRRWIRNIFFNYPSMLRQYEHLLEGYAEERQSLQDALGVINGALDVINSPRQDPAIEKEEFRNTAESLAGLLVEKQILSPRRKEPHKAQARDAVTLAVEALKAGLPTNARNQLADAVHLIGLRFEEIPRILDNRDRIITPLRLRFVRDLLVHTDELIVAVQDALRNGTRAAALELVTGFFDDHYAGSNALPYRVFDQSKRYVEKLISHLAGDSEERIKGEKFIGMIPLLRKPLADLIPDRTETATPLNKRHVAEAA